MLLTIVRKQFLEFLLSLRFLIGAVLCLSVGIGATWVRTQAYRTALTDYRLNREAHGSEAGGYVHPLPADLRRRGGG